jgi:DNA ligase-1
MRLATLYKKASTGKIQEWSIWAGGDNDSAQIVTTYGVVGGKLQTASETIREGKNIGKANETNPYEQACLEAQAQWEKKKKNKGYVESIEAAQAGERDASVLGGIDPMLAHKYSDHAAKIVWPAYVQPKLDGHRCIAIIENGACTLWSRQRKPILSMPHIVAELERLFKLHVNSTIILDGELYNHDYHDNFEELTRKIRPKAPVDGHKIVQYWVYDAVTGDTFTDRMAKVLDALDAEFYGELKYVKIVPTSYAKDESEVTGLLTYWLAKNFEGVMVRNAASNYKNGRSYDLQKVKEFQDAEFEIVDVVPGKGHMLDKGVFVCKTPEGKEFKAKMVGKLDELRKYLDNKDAYIGKMLTVKFQKYSAENIPVFGVAMRVREDV